MNISKHFDKNNLHHAYLIEGAREEIVPQVVAFFVGLGIKTAGNPDFTIINIDNFKRDEALELRSMAQEKGFSDDKKIFVVCVNSLALDAQGILLKMFEEPIENTHLFLVVPDSNILLKTLVSRFYTIKTKSEMDKELREAEKFITFSLSGRIEYIKELLPRKDEDEEVDEVENISADSNRSKALKFLNALEAVLHEKFKSKRFFDIDFFSQIFKVREFLRQPGSSAKSLLESVALSIPVL